MIYDDIDKGLHSIMFPVREVNIYAETEIGRHDYIPNKKALINDDTRAVLSVVSESYQVLHNSTALELAQECCIVAFPNTAPANWEVFSIEAPSTHAHCRIDLRHKGKIAGYDWSFGREEQDEFRPFIRVCNSYNRTFAFSLRFGLIRWACKNGLVDWHSSLKIKVTHDVKEMGRLIEAKINEAKFRKVVTEFGRMLQPLYKVSIDKQQYVPLILSILDIKKPEKMPEDRASAWNQLEEYLNAQAECYSKQVGGYTAYALINAVTDIATRPPTDIGNYNFIRRERDRLQHLAGKWLVDFNKLVEHPNLLDRYLEKPSQETLKPERFARI